MTGALYHAALEECPSSEFIGIAMEYGTLSLEQTLGALRAEQWVTNHADADRGQHDAIKRQMRNAFYVDTDEWKAMVYAQMRVAVLQSLRALANGATSSRSGP